MSRINLPTDLLRTFITVTDLGGYTKAGAALNRTQPAISLQMRRLEELLDAKLIQHDGRTLKLTDTGKLLARYARQILQLNDEALAHFHQTHVLGTLRVGLATDFATAFLQSGLTAFADLHKDVNLEVHCDLSRKLLERLHSDQLDITIALIGEGQDHYLVRAWEERPIWVTAKGGKAQHQDPLPIVAHPEGCEYRNRMILALNKIERNWRVTYTNPGISGLQNAVGAGLGVSALTRKTLTPAMRVITQKEGFPPLEKIRIGLFYKHPRLSDAGLLLANHLITALNEATDRHFTRSANT